MPSLRQSRNVNPEGWQQTAPTPAPQAPARFPVPTLSDPTTRSPFMHAAMPLAASTADAFQRQFYGGPGIPTSRILPGRKVGAL
jgi:hypothetical protein